MDMLTKKRVKARVISESWTDLDDLIGQGARQILQEILFDLNKRMTLQSFLFEATCIDS